MYFPQLWLVLKLFFKTSQWDTRQDSIALRITTKSKGTYSTYTKQNWKNCCNHEFQYRLLEGYVCPKLNKLLVLPMINIHWPRSREFPTSSHQAFHHHVENFELKACWLHLFWQWQHQNFSGEGHLGVRQNSPKINTENHWFVPFFFFFLNSDGGGGGVRAEPQMDEPMSPIRPSCQCCNCFLVRPFWYFIYLLRFSIFFMADHGSILEGSTKRTYRFKLNHFCWECKDLFFTQTLSSHPFIKWMRWKSLGEIL